MPAGKVLIKISEVCAQVLCMRTMIEALKSVQDQWQVDNKSDKERGKGEQKEEKQNLCSQLHG